MIRCVVSDGGRNDFDPNVSKDCAVRALALFLEVPYAEARELLLSATDYQEGRGVNPQQFTALIEDLGLTMTFKRVRLTAKNFRDKLPKRAILRFNGHVAFYEDGVAYDYGFLTAFRGCKQTYGYIS